MLPSGRPITCVVLDDPGVRVELPACDEHDEMAAPPVVDEQHPVAGCEHPAHDATFMEDRHSTGAAGTC